MCVRYFQGLHQRVPSYIFLYKVKRKGICSHYPLERHIYAFRSATRAR
jgi:hypothetical protein